MSERIKHWDQYLHSLEFSRIDVKVGRQQAVKIVAAMNLDAEDIRDILHALSPENVDLVAHVHATQEMADRLGDDEVQCVEVNLGPGFKAVIWYALERLGEELMAGDPGGTRQ